jgi:hypothetical protein
MHAVFREVRVETSEVKSVQSDAVRYPHYLAQSYGRTASELSIKKMPALSLNVRKHEDLWPRVDVGIYVA